MKNKVNLRDLKDKDKIPTMKTSFDFDKKDYLSFKKNLNRLELNVREVLSEFIKRVNLAFDEGGGEVVFGINLNGEDEKKKS